MKKVQSKIAMLVDRIQPTMVSSRVLMPEKGEEVVVNVPDSNLVTVQQNHFEFLVKHMLDSLIGVSLETKKSRLKSRIDLALSVDQLTQVLHEELMLSDIINLYGNDEEGN